MNKTQMFLKGHSPTILTIIGSIGVISTAVLAVKYTPKAMKMIENSKEDLNRELTLTETVKMAWTAYIPAIISCVATIACIAGANYLNIKKQQSLTSAYMLLDQAFKEYKNRMVEEYGDDAERIYHDVSRRHLEEMEDIYKDTLFFEFNSCRFFEANIHSVLQAECKAKLQLETYGQVTLNDYYSYLGLEPYQYGEALGWSQYQLESEFHEKELEFHYQRSVMTNGLVCWHICTNVDASMDHFCF